MNAKVTLHRKPMGDESRRATWGSTWFNRSFRGSESIMVVKLYNTTDVFLND